MFHRDWLHGRPAASSGRRASERFGSSKACKRCRAEGRRNYVVACVLLGSYLDSSEVGHSDLAPLSSNGGQTSCPTGRPKLTSACLLFGVMRAISGATALSRGNCTLCALRLSPPRSVCRDFDDFLDLFPIRRRLTFISYVTRRITFCTVSP